MTTEHGLPQIFSTEPPLHIMLREAATSNQVMILRYLLDQYPTVEHEYLQLPFDAAGNGHTEAYHCLLERNPAIINKTTGEFHERYDHSALLIAMKT